MAAKTAQNKRIRKGAFLSTLLDKSGGFGSVGAREFGSGGGGLCTFFVHAMIYFNVNGGRIELTEQWAAFAPACKISQDGSALVFRNSMVALA